MKLIEAMKRLKVIEKRIEKNSENINIYASMVSTERPYFESEERQKQEVKYLIQSNEDLLGEYLKIKRRIEKTNLSIRVEMGGIKHSIADLLVIKRKLARAMIHTYEALNTMRGESTKKRTPQGGGIDGKTPQVVMYYREEDKNKGLLKWQDLYDNISSRLEVINATTDLME